MKTIFKVAKTELLTLFYSPIAWFLLVVFLVQCGVIYFGRINNIAMMQELSGAMVTGNSRLTESIFLSQRGLFSTVMQNLYLYIPLLTMSLISRETSSGTIKLLYSSPISVREIILGKFISMMVYSLLLVGIIGIFVVSGMFHIQNPESGMLLSSLLGFYLLLCAYAAIGLFMSCLTTYQVVAAICTFIMIGALSYIGTLWQGIAFIRELTYFLAMNGRTQNMLMGLITTKDIIYFILIVYIFLGLSIYKLRDGMESKPAIVRAGRYFMVVASALLIGYISSIPALVGYYDMTNNQTRTLTPQVQKVLAKLGDEPLEVTAYNNLLGKNWFLGSPEAYNENLARWEQYLRFKSNIKLKTVLYYDSAGDNPMIKAMYPGKTIKEVAEQYAKNMDLDMKMFKTPAEMSKIMDLKPEQNRYVMQLKWKGRTTMLRVFEDPEVWPGETEVAAAIQRLQEAKLPNIAFVTGDLERDINKMGDRDYRGLTNLSIFRNSFVNQGFDVCVLSLETQDIPASVSTVVLADPRLSLRPNTLAKLQKYIDNGGNLLIAAEPGKQAILNPLLQQFGVQLMNGTVIQRSAEDAPDLVIPDVSKFATTFSKILAKRVAEGRKVYMPGAAGLSYRNDGQFVVRPLLMSTDTLTWNRMLPLGEDMTNSSAAITPSPDQGVSSKRTTNPGTAKVRSAAVTSTGQAGGLDAETQKRSDALRVAIAAISGGPGTPEEKQQKMQELMAKVRKAAEARLTPEMKKSRDSIAAEMTKILNGPGTMDEKQLKIKEMVAKAQATKPTAITAAEPVKSAISKPVTQIVAVANVASSGSAPEEDRTAAGTVAYSPKDGDTKGPFTTALSLTRNINGKEQRIVVTGDADFLSNTELGRPRSVNFLFNTAVFSWLNYSKFPIDTFRPEAEDKRINLTKDQVNRLRIIYIWILPSIIFAFGAILLIRRKRK
ncbi:ABC transporter [Pedobacter hiemivivus]|uniref:ABC transporter n=1 Tax=Pedobacter hiemivivus TaxID=2530454 RepID=A0A4U1G5V7_9SPHI|nr:Gldg family protein [Pedobacter hiemivivus]TKC59147.1 ABC transporter [Pedobacter hiemivivus]